MLFTALPVTQARAVPSLPWGRETIVIHDWSQHASYGRHTAPLSLKSVLRGQERYNVHGFDEMVSPGEALVINEGQPYESAIESDVPVETLCVFFSRADAKDAAQFWAGADDGDAALTHEFVAVKRSMSAQVSALLAHVRHAQGASRMAQECLTLRLAGALIAEEAPRWRAADQLGAVRASTRRELYRRCAVGRAYLEAHFAEDVRLGDAAMAAGLSRAHFLRAYKACFGETPVQTVRKIRLAKAAGLISDSRHSVSEAAITVGYADFSAFSRAFKREFGLSPTAYAAN